MTVGVGVGEGVTDGVGDGVLGVGAEYRENANPGEGGNEEHYQYDIGPPQ